ncbi:MAG: sigma-70 family RNA polymerase sigma factor [Clostridia bacterium]|nr:sigma-70 family RNA polymerase sigma factor [Clostridia bacterium]
MNFTDEELVEKIQNGDDVAEYTLFERYKDLVVKISRGYFIVGGDLEDLIQEGMIGLYKAIKGYSSHKETTFKTFAVLCIKHQIQTAIKRANTNKHKPLSSAVSFQSFSSSETENLDYLPVELVLETTPAEKVIDKEEFVNLQKIIKNTLSPLEISVLKLYLQGYSYKEISKQLDISNKSIDNSLSRIKTKLKAQLAK